MALDRIDIFIVVGFLLLSLGIAYFNKDSAKSGLKGFFLGGGKIPWYLAGLSMVATTFGADTPLVVTELVVDQGVSGNWLWWYMLCGGMLTAIYFAKLWKRSGVLTEVEFINLRYHGKPARFLRGFKAVYLGFFINALIITWVNKALITLLQGFFELSHGQALWITFAAMIFILIYSNLAGLKGIIITDAIQFFIAMIGCIILAVLVLQAPEIGGIAGLKERLPSEKLNFFPQIGSGASATEGLGLTAVAFFTYIGVMWWSVWYPGAEPGGGGYVAQRMMSTKSEKDSFFATLFFQIAHYCLRPWPWIIVALCTIVLYPDLPDARMGYVLAMRDFLPAGLKGLLLVAFLGAYMSTLSTQLNWGTSYLVNDFYKPFLERKNKPSSDKKDVWISRLMALPLMLASLVITTFFSDIKSIWEFIMQCGAGLGLVLILRWFWKRINVWAEIAATLVPFIVYGVIFLLRKAAEKNLEQASSLVQLTWEDPWYFDFSKTVLFIVAVTTVSWIGVMLLTKPTPEKTLANFFKKVHPELETEEGRRKFRWNGVWNAFSWLFATVMVYGMLFSIGYVILLEYDMAFRFLGITCISVIGFVVMSRKSGLFSKVA